jgi:hypothetical protein
MEVGVLRDLEVRVALTVPLVQLEWMDLLALWDK